MSKNSGRRRLIHALQAISLAWLGWSLVAPSPASASTLGLAPKSCLHASGQSLLVSRWVRYSTVVDRQPSRSETAIDGGDDPIVAPGSLIRPNLPLPLPSADPRPSPSDRQTIRPASRLRC